MTAAGDGTGARSSNLDEGSALGAGSAAVAGAPVAAPVADGTTAATVAFTAVDTGALTSGVARGATRAAATGEPARCTRAAASALTRCSISTARSGARPAHSRRRLISRAWENASSDRIAMPTRAAKAAIAPTSVKELESDSASGTAIIQLLSRLVARLKSGHGSDR